MTNCYFPVCLKNSAVMQITTLVLLVGSGVAPLRGEVSKPPGKAKPAALREIKVLGYEQHEPQFTLSANTLDPAAIAGQGWKGYLSHMGGTWGMTSDLKPMMRLYFDARTLPWASLKPHSVDGFDVNTRNVGAHALLHAMLGTEKADDPVEQEQLAYILSITPGGEGTFVCHGELAENLLELYAQTGRKLYLQWAEKIIRELNPPVDSNDPMGGWLHLHVGWNIGAYAKWYALTGEQDALRKAIACYDRVTNSRDPNGDDGAFRSDGSFGGKSQTTTASWHMHGHTHIMPGMLILGKQLIEDGQREKGLEVIAQARQIFDWLYDPRHNPDAGSLTGWLGEWLMVATGWDRTSDCEGCTMGDVVETACALGAASRLVPNLREQVSYYDRAEQIFRGQVTESIFHESPYYHEVIKKCLQQKVAKSSRGTLAWKDQSARENHAEMTSGEVMRTQSDPPRGVINALQFDGQSHFKLKDSAALRLPQFSIYALVSKADSGSVQVIYSNYDNPINWGKGVSLALDPDGRITFFTTDGTEANYDTLVSEQPLMEGFHLIEASYNAKDKRLYVDGKLVASAPSKLLDYGDTSVAAIGALREFQQNFSGKLAELVVSTDARQSGAIRKYFQKKYGLDLPSNKKQADMKDPLLWLKADVGFNYERPELTDAEQAAEVERLYNESNETSQRMRGRLLGLCGFNDWVNHLPSTLDPTLPGIDMMGCCSDAVIRAAGAIWNETVTGDRAETRVNMAFNRTSPLVEVVSSLPHRGEVNIVVQEAQKVLVRVPNWTAKDKVRAFIDRKPVETRFQDSYVIFNQVRKGQQLTVTYPLRIAEIKETVGSLEGIEFTEKWRGNTIVDLSPQGKYIPMYQRHQLDSDKVPQ